MKIGNRKLVLDKRVRSTVIIPTTGINDVLGDLSASVLFSFILVCELQLSWVMVLQWFDDYLCARNDFPSCRRSHFCQHACMILPYGSVEQEQIVNSNDQEPEQTESSL